MPQRATIVLKWRWSRASNPQGKCQQQSVIDQPHCSYSQESITTSQNFTLPQKTKKSSTWLQPFLLTCRCTVESILSGCITVWFGKSTRNCIELCGPSAVHHTNKTPHNRHLHLQKASNTMKVHVHPSHSFFSNVPSGREYKSSNACTTWFRTSFFPALIRWPNVPLLR